MTRTEDVEAYLHRHIPISREMGVGVTAVDAAGVRLSAPLEPNLNHQQTAFGGSAAALAILSAWTLLHVRLREGSTPVQQIVIQKSSMEYIRPIAADFEARCPAPSEAEWARFLEPLERRGRGRIRLRAEVSSGGEVAATFHGTYVALR